MKRHILLTFLLAFIVTVFVACNGGGTTADFTVEPPTAEPEVEPTEPATEAPTEEAPTEEPEVEEPALPTAEIPDPVQGDTIDEAGQSIAELVSENADLTTLVTVLNAAGLTETLAQTGEFTIFAPTDEAFAALPVGTVENLLQDPQGNLADLLRYHVVPQKLTAEQIGEVTSLVTLEGEELTVEVDDDGVSLNGGIRVITTDIEASNGVIHMVDKVLFPPSMEVAEGGDVIPEIVGDPSMTIGEVIAANNNFSILLAALDASGLAETLSNTGEFTILAPSDTAFAQLPQDTIANLMANPQSALTDILGYHVLEGTVTAADLAAMDTITTLGGEEITVTVEDGTISLNGEVQVVSSDIAVANGVIHVIDGILVPSSVDTASIGSTAAMTETMQYEIPGDAVYPEGVAYDALSNSFFTDSTGDGTLYRGDLATGEVTVFAEGGQDGRTATIGLAVDTPNRRLWVAGGATQRMYVFDIETGEQLKSFQAPEVDASFINDVVVDSDGNAYFTDSQRPEIFVVRNSADDEVGELETFLDLSDTVVPYDSGFNVNGIVITPDENYLILNHSGASALFRVEIATGDVIQIETDEPVGGDGMVLDGTTLYAVQGNDIYQVELTDDYSSGTVTQTFTDESFIRPTTIAKYGDRLLVVNSQFNNRDSGTPELPFTITDMPIPAPAE